eukprot:SAG31_NODE_2689_length_5243_cov_3.364697_2_plen_736_part_00
MNVRAATWQAFVSDCMSMVQMVFERDTFRLHAFSRLTDACDRLPVEPMTSTLLQTLVSACPDSSCTSVPELEALNHLSCNGSAQTGSRPSWLQWPEESQCPLSSIERRLAAVNEACCSNGNYYRGQPRECSLDCAVELVPFYNECRATIDELFDAADGVEDGVATHFLAATGLCDECAINNGGCDRLTDCSNEDGHLTCGNCPPGYTDERADPTYNNGRPDLSVCVVTPLTVDGLLIAVTDSDKLCFDPLCAEPVLDHQSNHTVVLEGCAAGGTLGSSCRIGCMAGFEASAETEGRCTLTTGGSHLGAAYTGQNVVCEPERLADGSMSEAYCRLASTEAILDCCDMVPSSRPACSRASPPQTCVLGCAERWLPLLEDCEQFLSEFSQLSEACETIASEFLNMAPSSMQLGGAQCHPDANGIYLLQMDTIGGKPHYALQTEGGQAFHFYAINEPHSGFVVGSDTRSHILIIEDYESTPPWGEHEWREVCAHQAIHERTIGLTPAFTMGECEKELELLTPELTEFCCQEDDPTFEQLLASDTSVTDCPYDCAHRWFLYSEECSVYLTHRHPGLANFTAACATTHGAMAVIEPVDAHLAAGTQDQHFFSSEQGLVYEIQEVPGDGLQRTELAIIAPGTHHVLADRLDLTEVRVAPWSCAASGETGQRYLTHRLCSLCGEQQGAGAHQIDWYAPQTELGVDIGVGALEGEGDYHLGTQSLFNSRFLRNKYFQNFKVFAS